MFYVYLIRSEAKADKTYIGMTNNLKKRLKEHNSGHSPHTKKFLPWDLVSYIAFKEEEKALIFEKYLKQGSGHAFAKKKHLW